MLGFIDYGGGVFVIVEARRMVADEKVLEMGILYGGLYRKSWLDGRELLTESIS